MNPSEPIKINDYLYSIQELNNDTDNEYYYEDQLHSLVEYIHENKLYNSDAQRGVVAQTKDNGTKSLSNRQKKVLEQVFEDNEYYINYCQECNEQIPLNEIWDIEYCDYCTHMRAKR